MKKVKDLLPYLLIMYALVDASVNSLSINSVLVLGLSMFLIKHNDDLKKKNIDDKDVILNEINKMNGKTQAFKDELSLELTTLKNTISDLKLTGTQPNVQKKPQGRLF